MLKANQSVEKGFQILEKMAHNKGAMRLKEIAESVDMHPTTVLRFLNTLVQMRYVAHDKESSRYFLTLKLSQLGDLVSSQFSIRQVVHPYLVELTQETRESACLAIESDQMVVYIDAAEGQDSILRTLQRIGKQAPLHSTGVGKNLLLNYSSLQLKELVQQKGLAPLTPKTITDLASLEENLIQVRKLGYALDDEECELGVRCVAAPLVDHNGKVIASISISGPAARLHEERLDHLAAQVKAKARIISALL